MPIPVLVVWAIGGAVAAAGAAVVNHFFGDSDGSQEDDEVDLHVVLVGPESTGKTTIYVGLTGESRAVGSSSMAAGANLGPSDDDGEGVSDAIRIIDTPGGIRRLGDTMPLAEAAEVVVLVLSAPDLLRERRPGERWCRHLRDLAARRDEQNAQSRHLLVVSHVDELEAGDASILSTEVTRLRSKHSFVCEVRGDVRQHDVVEEVRRAVRGAKQ